MKDLAQQSTHAHEPAESEPAERQAAERQPAERQPAEATGPDGTAPDSTAAEATTTEPAATEGAAILPGRRPFAVVLLTVVALLAVGIDVIAKQLVVGHLREGSPVRLLGGVVYLVLTRNGGAAFSMGTSITWIFPTIAIAVIATIGVLALRLRSLAWAVALGLVAGGALGNLIDRLFRAPGLFRGQVVDFISLFSDRGAGFAIFNTADSALVCGVILAVLLELTGRRRDGSRVRH